LGEAEFVHDLQRRGMHSVAAEIAQEISVLLQNQRLHAGTGEQVAGHHAGRPAADNATLRFNERHQAALPSPATIAMTSASAAASASGERERMTRSVENLPSNDFG